MTPGEYVVERNGRGGRRRYVLIEGEYLRQISRRRVEALVAEGALVEVAPRADRSGYPAAAREWIQAPRESL